MRQARGGRGMVVGIAKIPASDQRQTEHIVRVALDGLRYHPEE